MNCRLGKEFPDGWEKDAGTVGHISLINWPDVSAAENKKYREELREREAKKLQLGFPLPSADDLLSETQGHPVTTAPRSALSVHPCIPGRMRHG